MIMIVSGYLEKPLKNKIGFAPSPMSVGAGRYVASFSHVLLALVRTKGDVSCGKNMDRPVPQAEAEATIRIKTFSIAFHGSAPGLKQYGVSEGAASVRNAFENLDESVAQAVFLDKPFSDLIQQA